MPGCCLHPVGSPAPLWEAGPYQRAPGGPSVGQTADMEEEFREFVAARSGALLRTAYLLAGDWATAEDLLQTALTKTYLAWKRLGTIEAVEPYTRRVLVNTATSWWRDRKSTRLNSSHVKISYAVFCLKKKTTAACTGRA